LGKSPPDKSGWRFGRPALKDGSKGLAKIAAAKAERVSLPARAFGRVWRFDRAGRVEGG
jgi:hypothetical protein